MIGVRRSSVGRVGAIGILVSSVAWPVVAAGQPSSPTTVEIAGVQYQKAIEIPATGAEAIEVVNRLGSVSISGWDREAVAVTATKHARSAQLGERLRVQVSSRNGREIEVRTYVRTKPAIPALMRRALRKLMHRQAMVLEAMLRRRVSTARAGRQLQQIQRELDALAPQYANAATRPLDLGLPVAKQGRLDLRLQVPRHLHIKARTFKDDLTVSGCRGGAAVSSEEGAVVVERMSGKVVTWSQKGAQRLVKVKGAVEVGGGEVDVQLVDLSGPVRAVVLSGTIDLRQLGARFATVRLIGGTIRVGGVPRGGRYHAVSRDADVQVDSSIGGGFQLRSRSATIAPESEARLRAFQRSGDQLRGTYGKRGGILSVSTRGAVRFE